ncbi:unnamed protein product [Dimorphilus gyrociliatus]|uniref:Uncharacterized protein n=1 Tax=Dimorphilus gyrociliatus TaxID=2664684 RepID=A0A7I8WDX6_9ANNE|nr:unnamed protein product [Dimorphilus gyrociliatus]
MDKAEALKWKICLGVVANSLQVPGESGNTAKWKYQKEKISPNWQKYPKEKSFTIWSKRPQIREKVPLRRRSERGKTQKKR